MLRVLSLDTVQSTAGGRMPDYGRLATYYERAGRPIDDSFVRYLTRGISVDATPSRFILESQIAESNMAITRLTAEARKYSDDNWRRGADLSSSDAAARASELQDQIRDVERNMRIRQGLLERASN